MKRKLLFAALCAMTVLGGQLRAQTTWTDKTSLITNPSFETDEAISDLTQSANRKNPTGWTVTYDTGQTNNGTQQWGTADASSKIYSKDGEGTFTASEGDKFFHLRENWHGSTTYEVYQTIDAANVPAGVYRLTAKIATSASTATDYTLTIQEGGATAVASKQNTGKNVYSWQDYSVIVYKASSETSLTIKATMKGGSASSSHWCMLVDDFHLYYADPSDVSVSNALDMTGAIVNPSFEWGNTSGWTVSSASDGGARLNSNDTYTTSNNDGKYVFNIWGGTTVPFKVSQVLTGLPDGYYKLTAMIASDQYQNIQVYCGNGKVYDSATDKGTGKDITTAVARVSGGSMEIGATSYSWFKADNFRLYYLGAEYEASEENPLALTDKASLTWNVTGTTVQWGIQFRETYNGSTRNIVQNDLLTQTITGLDNGNYRVTLWAEASNANKVGGDDVADGTAVAQVYANDATKDVPLTTQNSVAGGTLDLYTLDAQVTTHTLKLGLNAIANGANWHIIQIENLLYTGPLDMTSYKNAYDALVTEAGTAKSTYTQVIGKELTDLDAKLAETFDTTSLDAYDEINAALRSLIDAYVAAAPNYDLLATEKTKAEALGMTSEAIAEVTPATKTGLAALQDLKVAEYTFVTTTYPYSVELGSWTPGGSPTADNKGQHFDGTATSSYKEQSNASGQGWNAQSWDITFDQDVTLPAGNYVFKVAGRKASGNNSTLALEVKNVDDESSIGSIADFPEGDTGLGINQKGVTSFDPADADGFANNGAGRGWEWRYVKFSLTNGAKVNIKVHATATAKQQWISFCNYTLETDNANVKEQLAYNVAYAEATAASENDAYTNVTGDEKTALLAAIALDPTAEGNSYADATTALNKAREAFTAAAPSYDAYVLAKGYAEAITAEALPYATSEKIAAVATAKAASVTTAAEAVTATAAINTANRAAYESNMLAEGYTTTSDMTGYLANADGNTSNGWTGSFTVGEETQTNYWTQTGEPYTDADGNATNTYLDRNGMTAATFSQTIENLPAGKYIVSVTARAQDGITSYQLKATNSADEVVTKDIPALGNANQVFNRGWNVVTLAFEQKAAGTATIVIEASNASNFWMSFDRVRLINLNGATVTIDEASATAPAVASNVNVTLTRTLKGGQWNGFSVPFGFTVEGSALAGASVKKFGSADENVITMVDATEIVAGEPYLVKPASEDIVNPTFEGVSIVAAEEAVKGEGDYKFAAHLYNTALATDGSIAYVSTTDSSIKKLTSGSIKGLRSVFQIPVASASGDGVKALVVSFSDTADGIATLDAEGNIVEGRIYNLAGQRVQKAQKGLYIVGGKKVIVK